MSIAFLNTTLSNQLLFYLYDLTSPRPHPVKITPYIGNLTPRQDLSSRNTLENSVTIKNVEACFHFIRTTSVILNSGANILR